MKKIAYFVSMLLLIGIIVVACKKDDDSTPPGADHTVTGFTPSSGPVGTEVAVIGTNLTTQNATAAIGETAATVTGVNSGGTELYITVPNGAETGKISVTIDGVEVKSTANFTVTDEVSGPESIELAEDYLEMHTLDTAEFPEITNWNEFPDGSSIQIESNNPDIVDINEDGDLVALQAGEATIGVTIESNEMEFTAEVDILVEPSVLIVGEITTGEYDIAGLWINGKLTELGDGLGYSKATGIHGSYIAGFANKGEVNAAVLWEIQKNGSLKEIELTNNTHYSVANSAFDTESGILAVGYFEKNETVAAFWEMDTQGHITTIELTDENSYAEAFDVIKDVDGNKYVVGVEVNDQEYEIATIWKIDTQGNVTKTPLTAPTEESIALSVTIDDDGIIYASGRKRNTQSTHYAMVWKINNDVITATELTDGQSFALGNSIAFLDKTIFVGGGDDQVATIWKDNVQIDIFDSGNNNASVVEEVCPTATNIYLVGEAPFNQDNWSGAFWIRDSHGNITNETETIEGAASSNFYGIIIK